MEPNEHKLAFEMDLESEYGMSHPQIIGRAFLRHVTEITKHRVRKQLFYMCIKGEVRGEVDLKVFFGTERGAGLRFVFKPPVHMPEIREVAEHVNAWALLQLGDDDGRNSRPYTGRYNV